MAPIGASTDGTLRIKAKVRALGPRGSSSYLFLIPLIVWGVAAVTCYAISSVELDQINSVLGDIVFASIQAAISSRIRYFSTQILVAAAAVATAGGPGSASASGAEAALAQARADLAAEAAGMLKIHSGLIYGDEENDLHGSLYISTERQELLFGQNLCMRTQTPCRPTSDPYYAPTNNGLNALVKAVIDDAILLSADPISSLTVDNERFKFLMDVRSLLHQSAAAAQFTHRPLSPVLRSQHVCIENGCRGAACLSLPCVQPHTALPASNRTPLTHSLLPPVPAGVPDGPL